MPTPNFADMFSGLETLKDLRARLVELTLRWHPDRKGGDEEVMKRVNDHYARATTRIMNAEVKSGTRTPGSAAYQTEFQKHVQEILLAVVGVPGVLIELKGAWLWATLTAAADLEEAKATLKTAGFRYSANKDQYYHSCGVPTKNKGKKYSREEVDDMHGNKKVMTTRRAVGA